MVYVVRCVRYARYAGTFLLHFTHGGLLMAGVLVLALMGYQISHQGVDGLNPRVIFGHSSDESASVIAAVATVPAAPVVAPRPAAKPIPVFFDTGLPSTKWPSVKDIEPELSRVSDYIAKRYKVSRLVVDPLVAAAVREGHATGVDPILILAVTSIESRFNPLAESVVGAQGLMQIIPRFHLDKISPKLGRTALFDPNENLRVGALILKDYIRMNSGLDRALQRYGGAPNDSSMGYAAKVNAEMNRLREVMRGDETPAQVANTVVEQSEPEASTS